MVHTSVLGTSRVGGQVTSSLIFESYVIEARAIPDLWDMPSDSEKKAIKAAAEIICKTYSEIVCEEV